MKLTPLIATVALLAPLAVSAGWQPAAPQQRPANILMSPQAPRGNIYGVVNRFQGIQNTGEAYLAKIDLASGALTPLHYNPIFSPYTGEDYLLQTNTLRNGEIVCPSVNFSTYNVEWDFMDLETGAHLHTVDFGADMLANAYSMTYDTNHDLIYIVSLDGDTDGQFSVVDPSKDYAISYIGNLRPKGGFIAALAYNMADGQLYAFNDNNNVYTLDTKTGSLVEAGYLELPTGELLFQEGVSGQVVYSPADQMFICIFRDNSIQASRVLYIHPETFEVFEGAVLTADKVPYVTSIFCPDEFAVPEAPSIPENPVLEFDGPALSGSITVKAPVETYAGMPLGTTPVRMNLTIDGATRIDKDMAPGSSATISLTLPEGDHVLVLTAWLGDARSPERRVSLYTGNDAPQAPAALTLDNDILSWQSVPAKGVHGGYVDTSAVTYQVYMDGALQNPTPTAETRLRLAVPADFDLRKIEVCATANSQTSPAGVLSTLFGAPLALPFHQAPTEDESRFYAVSNLNNDERAWFYANRSSDEESIFDPSLYGWCFATGYMEKADDWLMLPPVNITDPSQLYSFSFNLRGIFTIPTVESYEVWISHNRKPAGILADGTCILSNPHHEATTEPENVTLNFGVSEPGAYTIAFHAMGSPETESQGVLIGDFDIRSTGKSSVVPADPTDVSVTPAPLGRNAVLLSAKMPALDISGNPLPASEPLTLTMAEGEASVTADVLPGQAVTLELPVEACGYHYPVVTPASANGKGYSRCYSLYAGLDRPLNPTNVRLEPSADNLTLHLSWDAPGTTGENGGYVDPENLLYKVYAKSDSNSAMFMGDTNERNYSLSPFSTSNPQMTAYTFGVTASNEGGESYNTGYAIENLGTPYELPMLEEWGDFAYSPYTAETTGIYSGSSWEAVASMNGMGIGDPRLNQGGLIAYASDRPTEAMVVLPKATTAGISKADFILRYWDYAAAPAKIVVYGRRYGATRMQALGEFVMERPASGKWVDGVLPLPSDFLNAPWIEIRIGSHLSAAADEYLLLDSFQLFPDAQRDLKLTSLTAPDQICIGETAACSASVANSGKTALGGTLAIELRDADGHVYASEKTSIPNLASGRNFDFETAFDIDGTFRDVKGLNVTAIIDCADEDLSNNTRSIPLTVFAGTLPVVNDLQGSVAEGGVRLDWQTPPTAYGDFETFEEYEPFAVTDHFGSWLNFDFDGLTPITIGNSDNGQMLAWAGSTDPQGWTVVDMDEIGFMNDARLAPHSGKKVLMARAGEFPDEENPLQSSKWLVSPEIKGGTQLSFWMSTVASDYKEFIEIWYSTTDTALDPEHATSTRNGSFRRLRTFSKEGSETWELIQCALPSDAKYFAIRYCSYDSLGVVIDDISYTPAKMLDREIAGYTVYRSDDGGDFHAVSTNILIPGYTDKSWPDSKAWYYVTTSAKTETGSVEGPASNKVYINGTAVDSVDGAARIFTAPGLIILEGMEGSRYTVASADGRIVARGTAATGRLAISVDPGVYVVKAGSSTASVIVR